MTIWIQQALSNIKKFKMNKIDVASPTGPHYNIPI